MPRSQSSGQIEVMDRFIAFAPVFGLQTLFVLLKRLFREILGKLRYIDDIVTCAVWGRGLTSIENDACKLLPSPGPELERLVICFVANQGKPNPEKPHRQIANLKVPATIR